MQLSKQDADYIARVAQTEADNRIASKNPLLYQKQIAAITQVIINRVKSSKFPNTVAGVLNQKLQFTKITGPQRYHPYGTVQNTPRANRLVTRLVDRAVGLIDGGKDLGVGDSLHFGVASLSDKGGNRKAVAALPIQIGTIQFGTRGQSTVGPMLVSSGNPAMDALNNLLQGNLQRGRGSGIGDIVGALAPQPRSRDAGIRARQNQSIVAPSPAAYPSALRVPIPHNRLSDRTAPVPMPYPAALRAPIPQDRPTSFNQIAPIPHARLVRGTQPRAKQPSLQDKLRHDPGITMGTTGSPSPSEQLAMIADGILNPEMQFSQIENFNRFDKPTQKTQAKGSSGIRLGDLLSFIPSGITKAVGDVASNVVEQAKVLDNPGVRFGLSALVAANGVKRDFTAAGKRAGTLVDAVNNLMSTPEKSLQTIFTGKVGGKQSNYAIQKAKGLVGGSVADVNARVQARKDAREARIAAAIGN